MLHRPQDPDRLQYNLTSSVIRHRLAVELHPPIQQVPEVFAGTLFHQRNHHRSPLHMMKGRHQSVIRRINHSRPGCLVRPTLRPLLQLPLSSRLGSPLPMLLGCRPSLYLNATLNSAQPHFFTTRDLFRHSQKYLPRKYVIENLPRQPSKPFPAARPSRPSITLRLLHAHSQPTTLQPPPGSRQITPVLHAPLPLPPSLQPRHARQEQIPPHNPPSLARKQHAAPPPPAQAPASRQPPQYAVPQESPSAHPPWHSAPPDSSYSNH